MRFDHAGVATDDAEGLAFRYEDLFGCEIVHEERFDDLLVLFLDLGNGYFEVLEPREEGTLSAYLENHGAGLHHIALETDDIEGALERAAASGVELIDETPRPGAWNHRVAFLHPGSTGGVLVEFVEH
jgi:methylmalonyl-CoA/ethylmalonyl-CoA epimerase